MKEKKYKPIRSERKLHMVHDPWGSNGRPSQQEDITHFLSASGGLESEIIERQIAFDCGCLNRPSGGFCRKCVLEGFRGLICESCFAHCHCGQPICRSHSGFIIFSNGIESRLCGPCIRIERKRLRRMVCYFSLYPFF